MRRALAYVALPAEVTRSEVAHLERTNRLAWPVLAAAVPLIAALAWRQQTGALVATELTVALAAATFLAGRALSRPRLVSVVNGAAAMALAALVVRFGPASLAGELHGGFYVLLATLVVSCNPVVILVAAAVAGLLDVTVLSAAATASSGLGFRLGFLALEAAACCVVARSFFDNLVGAEKTVRARTHELERKTRDLEVFLDIVDQGFVTLTRDGAIVASSAAFVRTFDGDRTDTFFDRLERKNPSFAADSRLAWGQVEDDVLPVELALAQMPSRLVSGDRVHRLAYRVTDGAAGAAGAQFIAVVSDITREIAGEKAERDKREGALLLQRVVADRQSVASFVAEGRRVVELLQERADLSLLRRGVHTLKGNAAVLGASSIAEACHTLETRFAERDELSATDIGEVVERFRSLEALVTPLLAVEEFPRARREQDLDRLEALVQHGAGRAALLEAIADLRLEPVQPQLVHLGDHARDLALRLGRAPLAVTIEAHDARMKVADTSSFWSAFVHLVHNAVDHGIETESERLAGGKARVAQIHLRAGREPGAVFVEIEDDGRGIDWDRVEARAKELGLPARTSQEEALFADGVSTAGEIDDLSGRGIGMGAVRAAVEELRGALTVDSRAGKGTRIRATLPALERHFT